MESRIHKVLDKIEEEGLEELVKDKHQKVELLIDNLNTIKLMNTVGDKRMSTYFYQQVSQRKLDNINIVIASLLIHYTNWLSITL